MNRDRRKYEKLWDQLDLKMVQYPWLHLLVRSERWLGRVLEARFFVQSLSLGLVRRTRLTMSKFAGIAAAGR